MCDASDVIRRRNQKAIYVDYMLEQTYVQPTVNFSTLCTFQQNNVIHRFPTYDAYVNVVEGLKVHTSTCATTTSPPS
jgi:hypothetical protein